jgi:hypothetical protein
VRLILVLVAFLAGLAVASMVIVAVGGVVYPGALKWTAPQLCPEDQPDPFVIRTTTQDSDGTSTSFSLFCMGERGDFSEAGSWRPLGLLVVWTYGALVALTVLVLGWRAAAALRN